MKQPPPPSRLHQQEPPYQSPARPPPLLHQQEPSQHHQPPPPLHQQEPLYQSPPRPRPPPLHQQEPSYQSPPRPPPPPLHQQEPSQAPRPRGPRITYIPPRRVFHTPNINFKSLVQRLTGMPPTSTAPSTSSPYTSSAPNYTSPAFDESPAMEMYAELEKTKPRLGFMGGVETTYPYYHHQNRDNQLPNLSPGPPSLPSISPELFSTTNPQDLQPFDFSFPSPSMADGHWNPNQLRHHQPLTSSFPHGDDGPLKRPRFDLGHDIQSYVPRDEDRGIPHSVNDTRAIGSDYDIYQRSVQTPSLPSIELARFNSFDAMGRPGGDNLYMGGEVMSGRGGVFPTDFGPNGTLAIGSGRQDLAGRPSRELLRSPPDASSTLFVEGLPSDCSMREVAHIFRPFSGYKNVRFVTKDSKQRNEDPVVLCFVDFENHACAATARNALQGYRMDEEEPDSKILQIQFSRNPGPRPG